MRSTLLNLGKLSGTAALLLVPVSPALAGLCTTPSPQLIALGEAYYDIDEKATQNRLSERRVNNYVDDHGLNQISRLGKVNRIATSRALLEEPSDRVAVHSDVPKFLAILEELDFKTGSGTRFTCLHTSTENTRSVRLNREDVNARNSTFTLRDMEFLKRSNGGYILKAYEEDSEKLISQRVDIPSNEHWIQDSSVSTLYTVSEKYRRRNFNGGVNEPHIFESVLGESGVSLNPAINNPLVPHASSAGAHLVEVQLSLNIEESRIELNRIVYINGYWAEELHWNIGS